MNFSLLSHDLTLASIQEKNNRVRALTKELEEVREERDDMIYSAKQNQISISRIARVMGTYPANLNAIIKRVEQRKQGLR